MTIELHCKACGALLVGETEEELVANVQAHAQGHGHTKPLTAAHIRYRLEHEKQSSQGDEHAH